MTPCKRLSNDIEKLLHERTKSLNIIKGIKKIEKFMKKVMIKGFN